MSRYLKKLREIIRKAIYLNVEIAFFEFVSALLGVKSEKGKKWAYYKHEAVKKYLRKHYRPIIGKYKKMSDKSGYIEDNSPVWVFWAQGIQKAPWIVQDCYKSVKKRVKGREIHYLSLVNLKKYIDVPPEIERKVKKRTIPLAQFSDYVRVALLSRYGGVWLDATMFLTGDIDTLITGQKFFSIPHGRDADTHVCKGKWMVAVLAGGKQSKFFSFCREMMENIMVNEKVYPTYLTLDCVFAIAYEDMQDMRKQIDSCPKTQADTELLISYLKRPVEDIDIIRRSSQIIHKLSYKVVDSEKTRYPGNTIMTNLERI